MSRQGNTLTAQWVYGQQDCRLCAEQVPASRPPDGRTKKAVGRSGMAFRLNSRKPSFNLPRP